MILEVRGERMAMIIVVGVAVLRRYVLYEE